MTRRLKIRIVVVLMTVFLLVVMGLFAVLYRASKENYEVMFEEILISVMEEIDIEKGTPILVLDAEQKDGEKVYEVVCNAVPFLPAGCIERVAEKLDGTEGYLLIEEHPFYYIAQQIDGSRTRYAFLEIGDAEKSLNTQVVYSIIYGNMALAGLAAVSILLSRRLVKPVEQALQTQRQFIADASHELKTPLTVALSNLETLQYEQGIADDSICRRHLEISYIELLRMKKLIDDLLFIARSDSEVGKMAQSGRCIIDFSSIAACCAASFEPVFFEAERLLESAVEDGCLIYGDEEGLHRVVSCLLDNACKYSRPHTTTHMELKKKETGNILLTVKNIGENIPEKDMSRVFERFYRMDASREQTEGFGLGLAIAKEIVQKNKGKIWALSKPDGTVCFYVEIECLSRKRGVYEEGNESRE